MRPSGEDGAVTSRRATMSPTARCGETCGCSGSLLGRVLVEQEGEEFLAAEERVRAAARQSREVGDPAIVREAVRALPPEGQGPMLRAFALYFQLANTAEQHHRLRRRREYERRGAGAARVARGGVRAAGGGAGGRAAAAARRRLARARADRPSRPRRRGARCSRRTSGSPSCSRHLDDPTLTRRERAELEDEAGRGDHDPLADRRGARRAAARRRRDPSRALVLRGEPVRRGRAPSAATTGAASRGARPPFSFGTWIGGDLDGNPAVGGDTIAAGARAGARARRSPATAATCASSHRCSSSSRSLVGDLGGARGVDRARRARVRRLRGQVGAAERPRAVPAEALVHVVAARQRGLRDAGRAARGPRRDPPQPRGARRRPDRGREARRARAAGRALRLPPREARRPAARRRGSRADDPHGRRLRRGRGGAAAPRPARARHGDRLRDAHGRRRAGGARPDRRAGVARAAVRDDRRPARRRRRRSASCSPTSGTRAASPSAGAGSR